MITPASRSFLITKASQGTLLPNRTRLPSGIDRNELHIRWNGDKFSTCCVHLVVRTDVVFHQNRNAMQSRSDVSIGTFIVQVLCYLSPVWIDLNDMMHEWVRLRNSVNVALGELHCSKAAICEMLLMLATGSCKRSDTSNTS